MKILAIGRNYAEHIAELQNEKPTEPVVFSKPDTALLRHNAPFYYPSFTQDVHHELEVVIRICKPGKHIEEQFAARYYDQLALGVDFTARDIQGRLKSKGLPWDLAKGFDGAAPISEFVPVSEFADLQDLHFELKVNGQMRQQGHTAMMLYKFDYLVSFLSQYISLRTGDLIFTGTPAGVGPVHVGDRLQGFLEGRLLLDFEVK